MNLKQISIYPFEKEDQADVKALILVGLEEHWGQIDPTLNPDLDDIGTSYADGTFLVAWHEEKIIGTGALIPRSEQCAEIVRMSVATSMRRRGVGQLVLQKLCQAAREQGFEQLSLETTATWHGVVQFYKQFGFEITHYEESDFGPEAHFLLELESG